MDRIEVFQILGIEETKEEALLKKAYREKLLVTNPEDDPEGFRRLRTAYEEAIRLAAEQENQEEKEQRDETPSGLWVEKAAEIYENIRSRQDEECWRRLFMDDSFLSLEEEENCREKLLVFLMTHFKLPTGVWKLLDEKLDIVKGEAALRERFPVDFVRYIVNKCEHGEDIEFGQFEGADNAPYDLFIQYYENCWHALQEKNLEEAARNIRNGDELNIFHPVLEVCRASLYEKQDKVREAVEHLERLSERYPGDGMIAYNLAEMLWRNAESETDYKQRSADLYLKMKAENDVHYMANLRLTEWYYVNGQYQTAKKCAEKVLSYGSDGEFIELLNKVNSEIEKDLEKAYREQHGWEEALELCWCYLQDGSTSRGIRLAETLENQLPLEKEAEWRGLMCKLYVEEAEYEKAIPMTRSWEEALKKKLENEGEEEREKDFDRVRQAHAIRMQCFHCMGFQDESYWREALREGEKILESNSKSIGVLQIMAQINTELEEYEKSLEIADRLVDEYHVYAAYANAMEAYRRQLDAGGVIRSASYCIKYFPAFAKAYEYAAKVYLDLERQEDLQRILEDAEKNGVKSDILDAYRYLSTHTQMGREDLVRKLEAFRKDIRKPLEAGRASLYEEGLPVLKEYVYNYPDSYMFVELAIFHREGHHYEEARRCFEKALELWPSNPYAYNGLSFTYKYMGKYESALICIKKAILYMDDDMSPVIYTDMADLYSLLGDYESEIASLRKYESVMKEKNSDVKLGRWFMDSLAKAHLRLGQYKEAAEICKAAYKDDEKRCFDELSDLYLKSGSEEPLRELLRKWKKASFGSRLEIMRYYNRYGWTELIYGTPRKAARIFHAGMKKGKDPENPEDWLADAVLACILCGENGKGRKYASRLTKILEKEASKEQNKFFNRGKGHLHFEVLAAWYTASEGELEKLLEKEADRDICHQCTSAVCRELEGVRILFMLRQGKSEEARKRLVRNLEIQPADEYMLAIRHTAFLGQDESGKQ